MYVSSACDLVRILISSNLEKQVCITKCGLIFVFGIFLVVSMRQWLSKPANVI